MSNDYEVRHFYILVVLLYFCILKAFFGGFITSLHFGISMLLSFNFRQLKYVHVLWIFNMVIQLNLVAVVKYLA